MLIFKKKKINFLKLVKKENVGALYPAMGFEFLNPLPWLSAALQCYTHSDRASLSSPVGSEHGRAWKT